MKVTIDVTVRNSGVDKIYPQDLDDSMNALRRAMDNKMTGMDSVSILNTISILQAIKDQLEGKGFFK
jgi:hypothetical protein